MRPGWGTRPAGRKPLKEAKDRQIEARQWDKAKLEQRLRVAEDLLGLQKNNLAAELLPVRGETSYTLLGLEGSGRWLIGGTTPQKKIGSRDCCGLDSGDGFGRSRLGK